MSISAQSEPPEELPFDCAFIEQFQGQPSLIGISECGQPFGLISPNQAIEVEVGGKLLVPGSEIDVFGQTEAISVVGIDPTVSKGPVTLYHQREISLPNSDFTLTVYESLASFDAARVSQIDYTFATSGQFYLVVEEEQLIVTQRWWESLLRSFTTSAHAAVGDRTVIPFTVSDPVIDPPGSGASSVLFLPGIQASRLYSDSDIEIPGLFNDINAGERLWEPGNNNDIRSLAMTDAGESIYGVHTKDLIDTINLSLGLGIQIEQSDVYAGFASFMDGLATGDDAVIEDWSPYPYDWRYSVTEIAKNGTKVNADGNIVSPTDEIRRLATNSNSGKVTMVAHSNGGLLAKAIVQELTLSGEESLVDRIVLIGVPQLGTPKAIGTILHGYDQELLGGWVVEDAVAREVINNLPGAYGLLPSDAYLEQTTTPLITFEDSAVSQELRSVYGAEINTYQQFLSFLRGEADDIDRLLNESVNVPATANSELLSEAEVLSQNLTSWQAPAGIEVIEITGVGLATMESLLYRSVTEKGNCQVPSGGSGTVVICDEVEILKPYAEMSVFGDGTVMQVSGNGYLGDKVEYFLNFETIDDDFPDEDFSHYNLTEIPVTQELLRAIFSNFDVDIGAVSTEVPTITQNYSVEIIDSPVQIVSEDASGNQTGVIEQDGVLHIKEEIPGSRYFELGGTKYLVVPINTDRTTTLVGEAFGSYTLTVANFGSDQQTIVHELKNATVTPAMIASYQIVDNEYGDVSTDFEGDGIVDITTTIDGEVVNEEVVTYEVVKATVKELSLPRRHERRILFQLNVAERLGNKGAKRFVYLRLEERLLKRIDRILKRHNRRGLITGQAYETLAGMIDLLRDQR